VIFAESYPDGTDTPANTGTANDATSQAAVSGLSDGVCSVIFADMMVDSNAESARRAAVDQYRMKYGVDYGKPVLPMNAGIEVFDYLSITNDFADVTTAGIVGSWRRIYDAQHRFDKSMRDNYYMELQLGGIGKEYTSVQSNQMPKKKWWTIFDGLYADTDPLTDPVYLVIQQSWENRGVPPYTADPAGSNYFSPIFYDTSKNEYYAYLANPPSSHSYWRSIVDHPTDSDILYTIGGDGTTICTYSIEGNSWTESAPCPYESPAMSYTIIGGAFAVGNIVTTGGGSGATGEVISDTGSSMEVVSLNGITFLDTDVIDNGAGATANVDIVSSGNRYYMLSFTYYDTDDLRCVAGYAKTGTNGRVIRYTPTSDSWTVASSTATGAQTRWQGRGAASTTAGNGFVYGGAIGAATVNYLKYNVTNNTYSMAGATPADTTAASAYDRDKLWYYNISDGAQGYVDTADDSNNSNEFVANDIISSGWPHHFGVNDAGDAIVGSENAVVPKIFSLTQGGTNILVTDYISADSELLVDKQLDGYDLTIIEATTNQIVRVASYSYVNLRPGTWTFYYPQDADYSQIVLKRGISWSSFSDGIIWTDSPDIPMPALATMEYASQREAEYYGYSYELIP